MRKRGKEPAAGLQHARQLEHGLSIRLGVVECHGGVRVAEGVRSKREMRPVRRDVPTCASEKSYLPVAKGLRRLLHADDLAEIHDDLRVLFLL